MILSNMSRFFNNVLCRLVRNVLKKRDFRKPVRAREGPGLDREVPLERTFDDECEGEKPIAGF